MKPELAQIFGAARAAGRRVLDEPAAKRVLTSYGLVVPRGVTVRPGEQPVLDRVPGPFAVKLISPDASHKSDVGGVRLGVPDAAAAAVAVREFEALAKARGLALDGVLVEQMAAPGVELVIGGVLDARFGPVVMLGLGGVFVEIVGDTAFGVCPIDRRDALEMIDELRGAPLLRGARGREPVDEARIVEALLAIGGERGLMVECDGELAELDINPLIASAGAAVACDARIVLATPDGPLESGAIR